MEDEDERRRRAQAAGAGEDDAARREREKAEMVLALAALQNPELISAVRALSRNSRNRGDLAIVNPDARVRPLLQNVRSEDEMLARLQALPREADFGAAHQAPLRFCIWRGYSRCVDFLLQQRYVNIAEQDFRPLRLALREEDLFMVQQLIDSLPPGLEIRREVNRVIQEERRRREIRDTLIVILFSLFAFSVGWFLREENFR